MKKIWKLNNPLWTLKTRTVYTTEKGLERSPGIKQIEKERCRMRASPEIVNERHRHPSISKLSLTGPSLSKELTRLYTAS